MENHERIYLQIEEDGDQGRTWCQDRINDDDIEYIRIDIILPAIKNGTIDMLLMP